MRLDQPLSSTIGAAGKKGVLRRLAIKCLDDGLGFHRHLMYGAIAKINDEFRVAESPTSIYAASAVASISAGGSVAMAHRVRHAQIIRTPRKAAIAFATKVAVEAGLRHPDFQLDVRVVRGLHLRGHAAKGGQVLEY